MKRKKVKKVKKAKRVVVHAVILANKKVKVPAVIVLPEHIPLEIPGVVKARELTTLEEASKWLGEQYAALTKWYARK